MRTEDFSSGIGLCQVCYLQPCGTAMRGGISFFPDQTISEGGKTSGGKGLQLEE